MILLADYFGENAEYVFDSFELGKESKEMGGDILLAYYCTEYYTGEAFVLFRKDNKLFEVNAHHCSCYDLENQWSPEETSKEELLRRLDLGHLGFDKYENKNIFADELRQVLNEL